MKMTEEFRASLTDFHCALMVVSVARFVLRLFCWRAAHGLLIQRVIRIGYEEQVLQSVHERVDGEDGFPVFSKDV